MYNPLGNPYREYLIMKYINKINPIAKLLRDSKYRKQVIPNKKKKNKPNVKNWQRDYEDGKTK